VEEAPEEGLSILVCILGEVCAAEVAKIGQDLSPCLLGPRFQRNPPMWTECLGKENHHSHCAVN